MSMNGREDDLVAAHRVKIEPVWKVKGTVPRCCAECGVVVRPGDGGILVQGKRYCSDECADETHA
jgi:hypothetical protein